MKVLIASGNEHKKEEFKRILKPIGVKVITAKEIGISLDDVDETGKTFAENAYLKAHAAMKKSNMISIADDSGLCVDALGGAPGIYSARYAGPNASDSDRINKLLENLSDIPNNERTAKFVCSICCVFSDESVIRAEGTCNGTISKDVSGNGGFGYDPIFVYSGSTTFAQMSPEQKDKVSHRGNALRTFLREFIRKTNLIK